MTRDHTFHRLRVARIVTETDDTRSFVLDVPDVLRSLFAYEAGQFCTFRAELDGDTIFRCYSMSSAPAVDDELRVTVKRVPGGAVSGWMVDSIAEGDELDVAPPAGVFQLSSGDGDIVAFAAGSGITPIFSILKTALATTTRPLRLLYANRDRESVIFHAEIDALARDHPERVAVVHHLDVEEGFVGPDAVRALLFGADAPDIYVCGPAPFMDIVEHALRGEGIAPSRIHIERFTPEPAVDPAVHSADVADGTIVTIDLDGKRGEVAHRPGTTILQTAREMGMAPPFSCESGSCATCMARVIDGAVSMHVNDALTPEEVAEGWVLTCQSVPTTPTVHVVYGYD